MPFLLQRALSLNPTVQPFQARQNYKNVRWKAPTKVLSFWSIPENQKQTDRQIREETEQIRKKQKNLQLRLKEERQLYKKIDQNVYTLNFFDHNKRSLPKIKAFSKAEEFLVTNAEFSSFLKRNSLQGQYRSSLEELQRKEESYFHKLNIASKMQIKSRKNVYESNSLKKDDSSRSIRLNYSSQSSVRVEKMPAPLIRQKKPEKKQNQLVKRKYLLKNKSKSCDRWKLKDFYDPLLLQFESDEANKLKIKERQQFLGGFKQIDNSCEHFSTQDTTKYVDIFGRFNDVVGTRLKKRQRKLDKVQQVFGKIQKA